MKRAECSVKQIAAQTGEKKRLTVMGVEFVYLYVIGIIIAGIGWLAENLVKIFSQGMFDCRFHLLPFISPYALIPFAFQILLGDPDRLAICGKPLFRRDTLRNRVLSNLLCFTIICGAVFLGEYAIGNMWEALSGAQLWDYSELPLQVDRYAGLIPTLGYGGGAFLIFRFVFKPLLKVLREKLKFSAAKVLCSTLGVAIVLDTAIMCVLTAILHQPPMYWRVILW